MHSPVTEVTLRPATPEDSSFVYETKRAALGEYVSETWGWEESFQERYHQEHFDPSAVEVIERDGRGIGCLMVKEYAEYRMLEAIYLLPEYQRLGIGGRLVGQILADAGEAGVSVRLHVLKINPAARLYKRLEFRIIGETENHYVMEWAGKKVGMQDDGC